MKNAAYTKATAGRAEFRAELWEIALPVTLQCLLQSSFSVADQIMTGQLGSVNIAGIGLGGKFASIYSVMLAAIATAAGVMLAQYIGKRDAKGAGRSFYINLAASLILAAVFTALSLLFPAQLLSLYTDDAATVAKAAEYLKIFSLSFLPMALTAIFSAYLRCVQAAKLPLYAGLFAGVVNTGLNYLLIFGKAGFPALGARGAAIASVAAQILGCALTIALYFRLRSKRGLALPFTLRLERGQLQQYAVILAPLLVCEFLWSLGENVYAGIYGHVGTAAFAAMTLTNPLQALVIGALSGISQATGVMTGKRLGAGATERAYQDAKRLMLVGLGFSLLLSAAVLALGKYYVLLFRVEDEVRLMARQILPVYALIAPVKVQNMISGGILRSGGRTGYVLAIDMIGTWVFGVPLGLVAAFALHLPIEGVYLLLSLEECVRLALSLVTFRRRRWMQRL